MPASESKPEGIVPQAIHFGSMGVAAGALIGAIQTAWITTPPSSTLTVAAGNIASNAGMLGAVAAVFGATEALGENLRGPGMANPVLAGCAAGSLMGIRTGSLSTAASACGLFAGVQFVAQLGIVEGSPLGSGLTLPSHVKGQPAGSGLPLEPVSYAKEYLGPKTRTH